MIGKLFQRNPPPVQETVSKAMRRLKTQQYKIKQVGFRLKRRDRVLFQTCVKALENHDKDRATICANELVEVKRLVDFLYQVELSIERVLLRLETIKELSDIIIDLKPALRMLRGVSRELFEVLPEVSSELGKVSDVINETLYTTRLNADPSIIPVDISTPGGEEVIREVSAFLEQKITEQLPEPPISLNAHKEAPIRQMVALAASCSLPGDASEEIINTDLDSINNLSSFKEAEIQEVSLRVEDQSLEDVVFEYVKKKRGEVDVMECSIELNTSSGEIENALKQLGEKGKIKIENKMR